MPGLPSSNLRMNSLPFLLLRSCAEIPSFWYFKPENCWLASTFCCLTHLLYCFDSHLLPICWSLKSKIGFRGRPYPNHAYLDWDMFLQTTRKDTPVFCYPGHFKQLSLSMGNHLLLGWIAITILSWLLCVTIWADQKPILVAVVGSFHSIQPHSCH